MANIKKIQVPGVTEPYNVIDATAIHKTDVATSTKAGIVKIGSGITVAADGTISVNATAPVTSVNSKTGAVVLTAADVGARPSTWTPSKSDVGLGSVDNVRQYSASNPPPYPVTSVNGKTGVVQLSASDVGAVDSSKITTTLTDSNEQIPTSKAVADAMSASGYGDMLKAKYAPNSEDTVEKAYKDEDGNNIKDTYQKKGGVLTNTDVNIVIESGNYFLGSGNTNIPNDCEGNVMMVGGAGNAAFQVIFKFSTNSIVHRCYNGTSWTAWRDTNTALIVSATQPPNQSPGDLWYQIVE